MSRKRKPKEDNTPFHNETRVMVYPTDLKTVKPLTQNQRIFFDIFRSGSNAMMLHGVAGTGKTFIALYHALEEVLKNEVHEKVVIVRSAVPSRDIGFLPGDDKEKTDIYKLPYVDICAELFPKHGQIAFKKLQDQGRIEFMVTSFVRGLTINDAIVIVDEVQNLSAGELNTIMTRIGKNTRIIFCGDFRQTDLTKKHDLSGLAWFRKVVDRMPTFKHVEFGTGDIVRSPIVREFILACLDVEDSP